MNEIEYANRRFDPDIVEFHEHAKAMAKSVGYTATMKIDQQLARPPQQGHGWARAFGSSDDAGSCVSGSLDVSASPKPPVC